MLSLTQNPCTSCHDEKLNYLEYTNIVTYPVFLTLSYALSDPCDVAYFLLDWLVAVQKELYAQAYLFSQLHPSINYCMGELLGEYQL